MRAWRGVSGIVGRGAKAFKASILCLSTFVFEAGTKLPVKVFAWNVHSHFRLGL